MKTRACIPIFLFFIFLVELAASVLWGIQGIDRFKGGDLLAICISPNEKHEARAYLLNGGATTAFAVRVEILDTETDKKHNIYYCYHSEEAEMEWIDDQTIIINEIKLNIETDIYDSRDEKKQDSVYPEFTIENPITLLSPDNHYKAIATIEQWEDQRRIGFVTIEDQRSEMTRIVYRCEPCESIQLEWLDGQTILVNGIEIDVEKDCY